MKAKDVLSIREKLKKSRLISAEIMNNGFLQELYAVLEVHNNLHFKFNLPFPTPETPIPKYNRLERRWQKNCYQRPRKIPKRGAHSLEKLVWDVVWIDQEGKRNFIYSNILITE